MSQLSFAFLLEFSPNSKVCSELASVYQFNVFRGFNVSQRLKLIKRNPNHPPVGAQEASKAAGAAPAGRGLQGPENPRTLSRRLWAGRASKNSAYDVHLASDSPEDTTPQGPASPERLASRPPSRQTLHHEMMEERLPGCSKSTRIARGVGVLGNCGSPALRGFSRLGAGLGDTPLDAALRRRARSRNRRTALPTTEPTQVRCSLSISTPLNPLTFSGPQNHLSLYSPTLPAGRSQMLVHERPVPLKTLQSFPATSNERLLLSPFLLPRIY